MQMTHNNYQNDDHPKPPQFDQCVFAWTYNRFDSFWQSMLTSSAFPKHWRTALSCTLVNCLFYKLFTR